MTQPDPYADLSEVYAQETSLARIRVQPTSKTTTEGGEATFEAPEVPLHEGFHVDGDRRYQEK